MTKRKAGGYIVKCLNSPITDTKKKRKRTADGKRLAKKLSSTIMGAKKSKMPSRKELIDFCEKLWATTVPDSDPRTVDWPEDVGDERSVTYEIGFVQGALFALGEVKNASLVWEKLQNLHRESPLIACPTCTSDRLPQLVQNGPDDEPKYRVECECGCCGRYAETEKEACELWAALSEVGD